MLFRRKNDSCPVKEDNASEVVKVPYPLPLLDFYCTLTVGRKYINTVLKVDFDLDNTPKPKPVVGPDDLLLLLVQHWARDESVFPTEDDRHDLATIMLFNAYTGGRPAEFVHASKGKAGQDPLGEALSLSHLASNEQEAILRTHLFQRAPILPRKSDSTLFFAGSVLVFEREQPPL